MTPDTIRYGQFEVERWRACVRAGRRGITGARVHESRILTIVTEAGAWDVSDSELVVVACLRSPSCWLARLLVRPAASSPAFSSALPRPIACSPARPLVSRPLVLIRPSTLAFSPARPWPVHPLVSSLQVLACSYPPARPCPSASEPNHDCMHAAYPLAHATRATL